MPSCEITDKCYRCGAKFRYIEVPSHTSKGDLCEKCCREVDYPNVSIHTFDKDLRRAHEKWDNHAAP